MQRNECVSLLKSLLPELEKEFSITYLGLFGSFATNQAQIRSDVDLLVSFSKAPSLFRLVEFERKIKSHLNRRVDVVIKKSVDVDFLNRISVDLVEIKR